jgi:hypothetical protein
VCYVRLITSSPALCSRWNFPSQKGQQTTQREREDWGQCRYVASWYNGERHFSTIHIDPAQPATIRMLRQSPLCGTDTSKVAGHFEFKTWRQDLLSLSPKGKEYYLTNWHTVHSIKLQLKQNKWVALRPHLKAISPFLFSYIFSISWLEFHSFLFFSFFFVEEKMKIYGTIEKKTGRSPSQCSSWQFLIYAKRER